MTEVRYPVTIPGAGIYVVGVDIGPGQYVGDGAWVLFSGPGGVPRPGSTAEVIVCADDVALQLSGSGPWHRAGAAVEAPTTPTTGQGPYWPVLSPELLPATVEEIERRGMPDLDRFQRRSPRQRLVGHLGRAAGPVLAWWSTTMAILTLVLSQTAEQVSDAAEYAVVASILLPLCIALDLLKGSGIKRWRTSIRHIRLLRFENRIRAEKREGRIVTAADLGPEHTELLARAQRAIRRITGSAVNRAGLLDSLDNALTLREQEWEIASRLAQISLLEDDQGSLREVLDSIRNRVEALETYAGHVAEADLSHRARERLDAALATRSSAIQDLLAETARDDHAVKQIQRLDEHARTLRDAIRTGLDPKEPG